MGKEKPEKQQKVREFENVGKKSEKCQRVFKIFEVVREKSGNFLCISSHHNLDYHCK